MTCKWIITMVGYCPLSRVSLVVNGLVYPLNQSLPNWDNPPSSPKKKSLLRSPTWMSGKLVKG